MVGLGDLPGGSFDSCAYGVSGDGSLVVGNGSSASGGEAFRWTADGGMVDLDPGDPFNAYRGGAHWESDLCIQAVFAECIRDGKPPPIDVHLGLQMTMPGIAAVESMRQGGAPVPVPAVEG